MRKKDEILSDIVKKHTHKWEVWYDDLTEEWNVNNGTTNLQISGIKATETFANKLCDMLNEEDDND